MATRGLAGQDPAARGAGKDTPSPAPPRPLCGHEGPLRTRGGHRAACTVCGSFWDLDALRAPLAYDGDYPACRGHHDAQVGERKAASLAAWLEATGIAVEGHVVCEVGFGGGHALASLLGQAARVFGVDMVPENLAHAASLGIAPEQLFAAGELPPRLPAAVDLWLFLDSFEHVEEPAALLEWLRSNSTADARVLLVAPEAGSPSERALGRLWPHKLPDHPFHWSRAGLTGFFARFGFAVEAAFEPVKVLSTRTLVAHAVHMLGLAGAWRPRWTTSLPDWSLRFNFGEMGLVFRREPEA